MPNNSRLRMIENKEIIAWEHSLMASFPCRNKFLALALKKYAKTDIKFLGGSSNGRGGLFEKWFR